MSTQVFAWLGAVIVIFFAMFASWRAGRASYLNDLKKKHFEEWGVNRDGVSQRLHQIAKQLSTGYKIKDDVIKSLGVACTERNMADVELFSNSLTETNAKIDRLWAERHEADATAKFMKFGQLVDEIHAKGIPKPEPATT